MAHPKKKATRKTASPRKRKAPAKKLADEEISEERVSQFLWVLCGLLRSPQVFAEYKALQEAYQHLKPPARQELKTITLQALSRLGSALGAALQERGEARTGQR